MFDLPRHHGRRPEFLQRRRRQARSRARPSCYPANYAPGTIVINTAERRLYLIEPGGQALRYGIGVGRDGFRWGGVHRISAKKEWPGWTPPSQMRRRRPDLPRHMAGGIDNPLGARAIVSRLDALPHPRLERAGDDRPSGLVGLLPHDQ